MAYNVTIWSGDRDFIETTGVDEVIFFNDEQSLAMRVAQSEQEQHVILYVNQSACIAIEVEVDDDADV